MPRPLSASEQITFHHVERDLLGQVRLVTLARLPPGIAGITLGRWVLLRRDRADDDVLVAHELVHVEQWRDEGAVGFMARYVASYVGSLITTRSHRRAYLSIPAEREARRRTGEWMRDRRRS